DMQAHPVGAFAPPANIKLIPRTEWPDRIAQMEATKSRLSDIWMRGDNGNPIPALDQNDPKYMQTRHPRWGYCWFYGSTGATMILRAKAMQPYVRLSAFA